MYYTSGMQAEVTLELLKALADPTRLDIVRTLAREQCATSRSEVSTCSDLSQPAMSHHFAKLVDAGVLLERKEGKEKFCELNIELLQAVGIDPSRL